MHKLMEYICSELEELERKADKDGKLSMAEVQYLDTLAHAKKNLLKADEMWEESEYSNNGSYARGGRGMNARRDSRGRYSRDGRSYGYVYDDGYSRADDFKMELQELMRTAPNERVKSKLQSLMSEM